MAAKARIDLILLLGGMLAASAAHAAQDLPAVPQHGSAKHLGVATCASATCHGAVAPEPRAVILQNEYTTWQTRDKHANAYNLLLNEQSQRIARNLGLESAHTAAICLDCHTDNVPPERRGPQFQLSDGIGCEACHGGAQDWIQVHTIGDPNSHQRNLAAGLYPTADPVARAEVCLSCHLGDDTKFVSHRLMGAGHPRLSFELDTFTAIEPAHYTVDEDYRQRKQVASGAQTWATGQAVALTNTLGLLTNPHVGRSGLFPELTFFDCHACHKPMSAGRWRERASLGLGPGVVRFNDSNLIMLRVAADVVAPPLAEQLRQRGRALHQASQGSQAQWIAAAEALQQTSSEAVDLFATHEFDKAQLERLLDALVREGERGEYIDYLAAEQNAMAMGAILSTMAAAGWIGEAQYLEVEKLMTDVYAAVEQDERYRPSAHLDALKRLKAAGDY